MSSSSGLSGSRRRENPWPLTSARAPSFSARSSPSRSSMPRARAVSMSRPNSRRPIPFPCYSSATTMATLATRGAVVA